MAKITAFDIDKLRMPEPGFGDPKGRVDKDVLRAASWGTDYDVDARRNAISAALAGGAQSGTPIGAGVSPQQQYLNAIGWQGTEQQYYQSLGLVPGGTPSPQVAAQAAQASGGAYPGNVSGAGGGGSMTPAPGVPTGGMTPEQAYLQAIGWTGSEQDYYRSLGLI